MFTIKNFGFVAFFKLYIDAIKKFFAVCFYLEIYVKSTLISGVFLLKTCLFIHFYVLSKNQEVSVNSLQLWEHFLYMNVYMYVSIFLKTAFILSTKMTWCSEECIQM